MAYPHFLWETELNNTPHEKLLQISMKYPKLIDAEFANLTQHYNRVKENELRNQTIIGRMMPFNEKIK
jgi:hypothetical protein